MCVRKYPASPLAAKHKKIMKPSWFFAVSYIVFFMVDLYTCLLFVAGKGKVL
jgi:hypothetical protein